METVTFFVVVGGIYIGVAQIKEIADNQLSKQNDLALRYYEKLDSGINKNISIVVEKNKPILIPSGKFTTDQLEDYLNSLDDVGSGLNKKLLDFDISCIDFYDFVIFAHQNQEIERYMSSVRKVANDDTYWGNFDSAYDILKKCE